MSNILKNKKVIHVICLLGFMLILPVLNTLIEILFNSGTYIGTLIRIKTSGMC